MASNKRIKQRTKNAPKRGQATRQRVVTVRAQPGLDAAARSYAQLLADPCGAKLAHAVYSGGTGGYLARFETDSVYNASATDIGSMGFFCPGNIHDGTLGGFGLSAAAVVSDTATQNLNTNNAQTPGYTFLKANSASCRCVAACIQVSYVGSELTRAGVVALGQTTYTGLVGSAKSPAQLRTMAQHVRRMPDGMVELALVPNDISVRYTNAASTDNNELEEDMPALFWSVYGIPVNTGVRVRCVAVYEWIPGNLTGINLPSPTEITSSKSTLNDVLQALQRTGDWAARGFHDAAGAIAALGAAAYNGRALLRGTARVGMALMA